MRKARKEVGRSTIIEHMRNIKFRRKGCITSTPMASRRASSRCRSTDSQNDGGGGLWNEGRVGSLRSVVAMLVAVVEKSDEAKLC